ncbi:unnamed protein product, partial [Effrenium voratum]
KSVELNGQEGVAVSFSAGRWAVLLRDEARKVSVPSEKLRRRQLGPQEVRLRFCNVPEGYDSALMRQELEETSALAMTQCCRWCTTRRTITATSRLRARPKPGRLS